MKKKAMKDIPNTDISILLLEHETEDLDGDEELGRGNLPVLVDKSGDGAPLNKKEEEQSSSLAQLERDVLEKTQAASYHSPTAASNRLRESPTGSSTNTKTKNRQQPVVPGAVTIVSPTRNDKHDVHTTNRNRLCELEGEMSQKIRLAERGNVTPTSTTVEDDSLRGEVSERIVPSYSVTEASSNVPPDQTMARNILQLENYVLAKTKASPMSTKVPTSTTTEELLQMGLQLQSLEGIPQDDTAPGATNVTYGSSEIPSTNDQDNDYSYDDNDDDNNNNKDDDPPCPETAIVQVQQSGIQAFVVSEPERTITADALDVVVVVVVATDEEEDKELDGAIRKRLACCLGILLVTAMVVIIAGVVVSVSMTLPAQSSPPPQDDSPLLLDDDDSFKAAFPPTVAPTVPDFALLVNVLEPISGRQVFLDSSSPQYKALEWMSSSSSSYSGYDSPRFTQRYILAVFFFSLMQRDWKACTVSSCVRDTSGWLSNGDECDWLAISCNENGSVSKMSFASSNDHQLAGTLPVELSSLTDLEVFEAFGHDISGHFDRVRFGELNKLKVLTIRGGSSKLTGTIPAELGRGDNSTLVTLDLKDNDLSGSIPPSLATAASLQHLRLGNNKRLTGEIPQGIALLPRLKSLDLRDCNLKKVTLDPFYSATSLELLRLGGNDLSGSLSSDITKCSRLKDLTLGDSTMTGEIPAELYRMGELEVLDLQNSGFYGELSEDFGLLSTIREINLKDNGFYGEVPKAFDTLEQLRYLDLSGNEGISGSISSSLCNRRPSHAGAGGIGLWFLEVDCAVSCGCCGFRNECGDDAH